MTHPSSKTPFFRASLFFRASAQTGLHRRHRTLAWLLAATGVASIALLLVAMEAGSRSARVFQDVNLSGSLRYRSLWIYEAAQKNGAASDSGWKAQMQAMTDIQGRLHTRYPEAAEPLDPAWNAFSGSLRQTGQVDWRTADAMRLAADALTKRIAQEAASRDRAASLLLRLGLAGLLCSLAASSLLLLLLRAAESEMRRAFAESLEDQNLFIQSIDAMQGGYVVVDREGLVLLCNAGAERLLGREAADLIGQPMKRPDWRLLRENGEEFGPGQAPTAQALRTGQPQEAVVVGLEQPFAGTVWLSAKAAPIFHAGETVPYAAVLTFTDISAKRKTEEALRAQEEALQAERDFQAAMLESLQSGIVACNASGTLTLFNRAAREFHGMSEEPLPPEQWAEHFDLYHADGMTPLETEDIPLFRAFSGEIVRDAEMVIAPKDFPARTLLASGQAIYSRTGQKLGAVAAMYDITARRQTERELLCLASIVQSSEEAILAMTLDGTIVSWNAGAHRLYGYAESEIIGHHASVLAPDREDSTIDSVIPRVVRGETIAPVEVALNRRNGMALNLALTFSPLHDASGEIVGLSCISRDITARRQAEDALRESEARLRYFSNAAFEGIAVSQNGVMLDANPAFLSLYGYETREEIVGMASKDFAAPESQTLVMQKVTEGEESVYEALGQRRDGSTFQMEVRGRTAAWNGLPARVTAVRDITERKRMEDALRHSEEALRAMLSSAPVILTAADSKGIVTLSEGTGLAALGLAPGEAVGRSVFEFSGSDPVVDACTRRALAGEAVAYDMRYEALCLHVELKPQRDASGEITGIIGVSFDITERAQSEERFRVLFEQSSDAHLLFDGSGIIDCNPAAVAMLSGTDKSEVLAMHPAVLSPVFQPDGQRSAVKCLAMDAAAYETGFHRFEWMHRKMDGEDFPVEVTLTPVTLQGRPVMLVVWHDLTERKQAEQQIKDYMVVLEFQKSQLEDTNRELEALATTDGLTGLKNRRIFAEKLAEEHARAVRYHQPLSLLLLDVDRFKQYNDTFGHPAGDAVLRQVGQALAHFARDTDVTARYGGEEFVVILPQTDESGALVIAERLRQVIAGGDWALRPVTVSIGVCTLSLDTPTPESMTECADKALYLSKEAGRNQVTHGNPAAPLISRSPRSKRTWTTVQAADTQSQADMPK